MKKKFVILWIVLILLEVIIFSSPSCSIGLGIYGIAPGGMQCNYNIFLIVIPVLIGIVLTIYWRRKK